mmetsp:Transcript_27566/g.79188  ORF Transcript_27566/g.79188 Transcript_27566/m.79188 type:complete len:687 (-) Transcript_27566:457-2517(-)
MTPSDTQPACSVKSRRTPQPAAASPGPCRPPLASAGPTNGRPGPLRGPGGGAHGRRRRWPLWAVPAWAAAFTCLAKVAAVAQGHGTEDAARGSQAPRALDSRTDAHSLLQTRVEMSADSEAEEAALGRPLAGHEQGYYAEHAPFRKPNGEEEISLQKSPWSRPKELEINLQARLDSKSVPFKSIAGLSDDLDIQPETEVGNFQRVRHRHSDRRESQMQMQLTTQAPPLPSSTKAPVAQEEVEVPRMALTDYKSYRQAMVNFGDVQYISYITIGRQTISGILDTGSFELIVFSAVCQSCGQAAKYDAALSKSYTAGRLASGQSYGSGDTTSLEAFDNVAIGPFDEANQTFWEVFDAHMPILHHAAFQSIIGVGPPETPAADAWANAKKASDNLTAFYDVGKRAPTDARQRLSNKITIAKEMSSKSTMLTTFKVQMFSVCVGARPGSDGYFIWNDTSYLETPSLFTQIKVLGSHTWTVNMTSLQLDRRGRHSEVLACKTGCGAIVDSGTSLLLMPFSAIYALRDQLQSMKAKCDDLRTLPRLTFKLDGKEFSLPPDAYITRLTSPAASAVARGSKNYHSEIVRLDFGGGDCQLAVMGSRTETRWGPLWILGMPFFRKYFTTFNIGRDREERGLFVTHASSNCTPAEPGSDLVRDSGYEQLELRELSSEDIFIPKIVHRAFTESFLKDL